ncbi:fructokinase ScrK [Floricoccus penangensis]|uniref:fructokinase ScrK n=1 Tax=Floricoccus penangensis TaxID=1859475 RepID=UPI00203C74BC|nr:fructokinase ScrK [Floricoccus penangensis]URZ87927.1 ROK family protein [Floricoccus penangensis]
MKLFGSIEAGGTKFICAVGDEDYRVKDQVSIPTTTPEETLGKVVEYFKKHDVESIGIASFGPIEIRKSSPKYGYITKTPKPGWQDTDVVGVIKEAFDIPISWTTDVNGSAYGEYIMSTLSNEKIESLVYYTVGTGVGGGAVIDGEFLGGMGHTEMGHTYLRRHPDDLEFPGNCPFHGDCLEGLVAGPTFEARLGIKGENVPRTDPVFDVLAYYLAQAIIQVTLIVRPEKVVFGGSVVDEELLVKVRQQFKELFDDYVELPPLEKYITRPLIANNGSATLGNFALALKQLSE